MLTFDIDLSEFKTRAIGTKRILGSFTARAVRVALKEGADYARNNHVHTRQTGNLTSLAMLRGRMVKTDDSGSWGYIENLSTYARHVEYQTKAHEIRPINYWNAGTNGPLHTSGASAGQKVKTPTHGVGRGKFLRFRIGGRIVFARAVMHPGTPAMPFMAPAAVVAGEIIARETEGATFQALLELWE